MINQEFLKRQEDMFLKNNKLNSYDVHGTHSN